MKSWFGMIILLLAVFSCEAIAEEWRVAQFLSEGPLMPANEYGDRRHCDNRFVVVIKTNYGIGDAMYTATEDPAYAEFQRAERWIRTNHPDRVNKLKLLGMSFGRLVNAEFPNEEAVFADIKRANHWSNIYNDGCNYFNIKKSGKSFSSNPIGDGSTTNNSEAHRELAAYNAAFNEIKSGNYVNAVQMFTNFLKLHPNGMYAPNAIYWLGECHYATQNYQLAADNFEIMLSRYPAHNKAASAMLKLGLSQHNLGKSEQAASTLAAVVTEYPSHSAARIAAERLKSINSISSRPSCRSDQCLVCEGGQGSSWTGRYICVANTDGRSCALPDC